MKKYLFFDSAKCSACGACALACIDQNDVDVASGQQPFRHTFTLENKQGDLSFHSVSCMHCADAPCVTGCPRGCLTKDAETGFTLYDTTNCIGCHSCAMACPYGVPGFGPDGKMRKCDACIERQRAGMLPACVKVCPTGALVLLTEDEFKARRAGEEPVKITVFESAVQNKLHCAFFCAKLNLCGNAIVGNGKIAFKSLE